MFQAKNWTFTNEYVAARVGLLKCLGLLSGHFRYWHVAKIQDSQNFSANFDLEHSNYTICGPIETRVDLTFETNESSSFPVDKKAKSTVSKKAEKSKY